jgi:hypothetical protein
MSPGGATIAGTIGNIASQIYATKSEQDAADRAAALTAEAQEKELAYLREKDAQEQANWEQAQLMNYGMWDQTQRQNYGQWARRETQLAPVRASGEAAGRELAARLNLDKQGGATYLPPAFDYSTPPPAYQSIPYAEFAAGRVGGGGDYGYGYGGGGGGGDEGFDPAAVAFIRDWQSSHDPSASPTELVKDMQEAGFADVSPYLYGKTPSNNEVSLGGKKFKIKGAEGTPNAYWYYGGSDAPGASPGAPAVVIGRGPIGYTDPRVAAPANLTGYRVYRPAAPGQTPVATLVDLARPAVTVAVPQPKTLEDLNKMMVTGVV